MLKNLTICALVFLSFLNSYAVPNDLKVMYVDIDKVINQSIAGKKVTSQLENLNNSNIKKFRQKEDKLAAEEKAIIKQKNILSKEEFEKKVIILRADIKNFRNEVNVSKKELDKKRVEATNKILSNLNPILSEYSSKNSISLIIQKKNIVIGKSNLDITKPILNLLNAKIKSVKLN